MATGSGFPRAIGDGAAATVIDAIQGVRGGVTIPHGGVYKDSIVCNGTVSPGNYLVVQFCYITN